MPRTTVPPPDEVVEKTFSIEGTSLAIPIMRCHICKKISSKGMRAINAEEGLYICQRCDWRDTPISKGPSESIQVSVHRQAEPEISIDEAICEYCKKPIIDQKALAQKVKRRTTDVTSQRNRDRIERTERVKGWRALGKGKFAHNRCGL